MVVVFIDRIRIKEEILLYCAIRIVSSLMETKTDTVDTVMSKSLSLNV